MLGFLEYIGTRAEIDSLRNGTPSERRRLWDDFWARRLVRAYGTDARLILGDAKSIADMGKGFAATLTEREIDWLMDKEYARTAEDVVWRRSRLGLRMSKTEIAELDAWMKDARKDADTMATDIILSRAARQ